MINTIFVTNFSTTFEMSVGKLDRLILEDKRIRRILTNNEKLIRDAERKEGNTNLHQFNAYLANSNVLFVVVMYYPSVTEGYRH